MKWATAQLHQFLSTTGSTRTLGLLRISLAAILFARYGQEVAMFAVDDFAEAILGAAFFTLVALMLAGWRARATVALTAILLTIMYFHFGSQVGRMGWDHHHTYLLMVSVTILALTPCGKSFSLDRYLEVRRAQAAGQAPPPERGPLWAVKLFGLQLSAIYFWSAVDKSGSAFLSGERLEQVMIWHHAGRPLAPILLSSVILTASIAVVAAEYFLTFAIHIKRLVTAALILGVGLHAVFYLLVPVETFSVTMVALYLAVLDPGKVDRAVDTVVCARQRSAR
jgi:hypothetical protein